ncbi:MAG: DUF485 domain-containing protein [Gammaproteobacteria bacterium]|nr:DUF485 domain-containing protein [Gammaproteobacteria bacterium]
MRRTDKNRGWIHAVVILGFLALFIAGMAGWPEVFALRLFGASYLTVGILFGSVAIIGPVVFTALHNRARKQADVDV